MARTIDVHPVLPQCGQGFSGHFKAVTAAVKGVKAPFKATRVAGAWK